MLSASPDTSPKNSSNPANNFICNMLSHDGNIMLVAIISLLVVVLFVLLLHVYAKWFLVQARQRSRRSVSAPQVLRASFDHFHTFTTNTIFALSPTKDGLESSVISSIPLFKFKADDEDRHGLIECAICLSPFEDEEMGRILPRCNHAFHVNCIDMWLHSHSTCPICRSPVLSGDKALELNVDEVVNREICETMLSEIEICDDETSKLEIVVEEVPDSVDENGGEKDTVSLCSSSLSSHAVLGDSVKRIMSRNRSERKVHPSNNDDDQLDF